MTIQIRPVTVATDTGKFRQEVRVAGHVLHADEPASYGGDDTGPAPHEWVLAGSRRLHLHDFETLRRPQAVAP
jgi:uncharacterized OsmC-like protein